MRLTVSLICHALMAQAALSVDAVARLLRREQILFALAHAVDNCVRLALDEGSLLCACYAFRGPAQARNTYSPDERRLKDRNRVAQRKYRQKRKERLQSTEDRLAFLEAKVEALSLDKVAQHLSAVEGVVVDDSTVCDVICVIRCPCVAERWRWYY